MFWETLEVDSNHQVAVATAATAAACPVRPYLENLTEVMEKFAWDVGMMWGPGGFLWACGWSLDVPMIICAPCREIRPPIQSQVYPSLKKCGG